ncbi:MAG: sulfurtransferase-like selenium metabolism protein YedF [Clostridiales Family XIII bacterium]|nr:sulfurtransferase-like selenium metabolism protein YedF [Clostridiales Family XIII bacterium]
MKTIDMLGEPCPIPVISAKKALAEAGTDGVKVLVDNIVAVQNLEKMANGTGRAFSYVEESSNRYAVSILASDTVISEAVLGVASDATNEIDSDSAGNFVDTDHEEISVVNGAHSDGAVVLITANHLGEGAEELGKMLIKGFIFSLTEQSPLPQSVLFLNGGAHLTTQGANTVPDLQTLEEMGVEILTCGTCANYYNLSDSLAVGAITDMMGIVNRLTKASKVITI